MRREVDFRKVLCKGEVPILGFIAKVSGAKAITKERENGTKAYSLETEIDGYIRIKDDIWSVPEGLYQVCDIVKWNDETLQWNFYLVVVTEKKEYVVAEFLNSPYTLWVKDASNVVKQYFKGKKLEPIIPTPKPKIKRSQSWGSSLSVLNQDENKKPDKQENAVKPNIVEVDFSKCKNTDKAKQNPPKEKIEDTDIPVGMAFVYRKNGNLYRKVKINRFNKKYIEVTLKGEPVRFYRETGEGVKVSYRAEFNI